MTCRRFPSGSISSPVHERKTTSELPNLNYLPLSQNWRAVSHRSDRKTREHCVEIVFVATVSPFNYKVVAIPSEAFGDDFAHPGDLTDGIPTRV